MPGFLPENQRPPRSEMPPRKCNNCKIECVSECICGECYCSRACQLKEWREHKRTCDLIRENNFMSFMLTELFWKSQGVQ